MLEKKINHVKIDGNWIPTDDQEFVYHSSTGSTNGMDTYWFRGTCIIYGWGPEQINGAGWSVPSQVMERVEVVRVPLFYASVIRMNGSVRWERTFQDLETAKYLALRLADMWDQVEILCRVPNEDFRILRACRYTNFEFQEE